MEIRAFILVILVGLLEYHSVGQTFNTSITDPVRSRAILVDLIDRDGLLMGEMGEYYQADYDAYEANAESIELLKPLMEGVTITVILGTWCGDSKEQMPRFMKVLDLLQYPAEGLLMIGVDSHKSARLFDVSAFEIEKVPTFIFTKAGMEIGRIVETPIESLEADMLGILK